MDKSLYYNPQGLLSYNRILNFVIGARGIGKSYSFKKMPIKKFIEKGEQFIYIRRYKTDLKKVSNYFKDIAKEFPDHRFEVKGREFWIDKKLAGWAIPLSSWQSEKSTAYPDVTTMIYDEFLIEKSTTRYLPNEVNNLLNLMDTVVRERDNVRVFCLSNATTIVNPYFIYFGLAPDITKRFNKYDGCVVEVPDSVDFTAERKKTKFGQLINGTDYGEMSLENKFTQDSMTFVEKRPSWARFMFRLQWKNDYYGVWIDDMTHTMYLSKKFNPNSKLTLVFDIDEIKNDFYYIKNYKNHYATMKMVSKFKSGEFMFEDLMSRTVGYAVFKQIGIY